MEPLTSSVRIGSDCGSFLVMTGGSVSRGSRLIAAETFSRISCAAPSISRSSTKVQVMSARPSLEYTVISSIPLTEEIASSRGSTTPVTTSSGVAPGSCTSTLTVAGSALGKRSTARPRYEKMPSVTRKAISITVKTGYLTQISASFMAAAGGWDQKGRALETRTHAGAHDQRETGRGAEVPPGAARGVAGSAAVSGSAWTE